MPTADSNGLKLEYETFGDPAHEAIVLVMGLAYQMIMWPDAFCTGLAARGFHVVRFDNRDSGLSTHLTHLGTPRIALEAIKYALHLPLKSPYRIDDMARDTEGLIDGIGLRRVHLVGASMGGMIAQNLAAMAPAKVASLVSVMSTTGSRKLPPPTREAKKVLMQNPAPPSNLDAAREQLLRAMRVIGSRSFPDDEAYLRALCERHVRRSYDPPAEGRQLLAIAASGDRTAVIRGIRVPTLVLHGDEDPLLRPQCGVETARVLREAGRDVTFEMVRGMGHDLPQALVPQLAERIAAFCAAHPARQA